ncbi:flagellar motility protein MotE (MotC chaperone) [Bradyrhizobium sp. USDA 328]
MKSFRNIRVIPVVLVAVAGLATLKVAGLAINGGYVFDYKPNQKSWAEENLNFPTGRADPDITGSTHGAPKEAPKPAAPETKPEGTVVKVEEGQPQVSASERAILERLQARRQEIEARQREIDIRESLLKSAEKRIENKVEEMKAVETRISATQAEQKAAEAQRMKGLVTMYEGMKPKDAARVFDRLEMGVLIEIALGHRASQNVGHHGIDVAGGCRAADGRDGSPRQWRRRSVGLGRRSSQDRGQADAKAELRAHT